MAVKKRSKHTPKKEEVPPSSSSSEEDNSNSGSDSGSESEESNVNEEEKGNTANVAATDRKKKRPATDDDNAEEEDEEEGTSKAKKKKKQFFATDSFASLPLSTNTQTALSTMGFTQMTQIQSMSIPALLAGKDLIGAAKTGSGKTLACKYHIELYCNCRLLLFISCVH